MRTDSGTEASGIITRYDKPVNNFCLLAGHLSGQRQVLTGQEASLAGQKYKSV